MTMLNPQVDKYLIDGCMRCKYGGTPQCKVLNWTEELEILRQIVLETGLTEEIKWGVPVYTRNGKNIVTINALKNSANIGFYQGAILKDSHQILEQQGNIQSARLIRFTDATQIKKVKEVLKAYILEAIQLEENGIKVKAINKSEPIPKELRIAFEEDPAFHKAFEALTPGRQRGYIIYFSGAKQATTRTGRIEKCKGLIYNGIGLHDKYSR